MLPGHTLRRPPCNLSLIHIFGAQATDGSFTPNGFPGPGGLVNSNGGSINDKIYRQCLATLMLEVYYRVLPGTGEGTRNS